MSAPVGGRGNRCRVELVCIVRLPIPVDVTPGTLGKTARIVIGGRTGRLLFPQVEWHGDRPSLAAPELPSETRRHVTHWADNERDGPPWGGVGSYNPAAKIVRTVSLGAFVFTTVAGSAELTYGGSLVGRGAPCGAVVDELLKHVDPWRRRLAGWLEVRLDQALDPDHPLHNIQVVGEGMTILTVEEDEISSPAWDGPTTIWQRSTVPATLPMIRRAAVLAGDERSPGTAHVLLRDAAASMRRGNQRRAIIEAGTALEIALADLHRSLTNPPLTGKITLGRYVDNPRIQAAAQLPANTKSLVVTPRNEAIHNNIVPTKAAVASAIQIVRAVLIHLDPLPL